MPRKSKKAEEAALAAAAETAADDALPAGAEGVEDATAEPSVAVGANLSQVVTFQLEGQLYGLPIGAVQEIQQLAEFTPLPDVTPALVGLIDVRGIVVPALDLRILVGLPKREFTLETPMIFCRVGAQVVCLVVDAVEDVVELPADAIQPPSPLVSLADRLLGMCRLPQGLVLILDIERLIPEAALSAAGTSGGGR